MQLYLFDSFIVTILKTFVLFGSLLFLNSLAFLAMVSTVFTVFTSFTSASSGQLTSIFLQEKKRLKEKDGGGESEMKCRRGSLLSFHHYLGLMAPSHCRIKGQMAF